MTEPKPKPKRDYSAKVKLLIAGSKKPRYMKSTRDAVRLYRDLNMRLMQLGQPPRTGSMEAVRGWDSLTGPVHLTVTSTGGVVVHRKAKTDDFRVAAPVWPGVQP